MDFTFSAENENWPKMTFHFRPKTETKTKTATYFRPKTKTKTKLSSSSNNMRQSNVLLSIREWLQYSYLETGLNWQTSAAVMQWHADTPWQQTLCPSLSEPQIVNAFKSHYVAAATAAEARISLELRPTIRWLWSSLFMAENYCVFGRKQKKNEND